ncbi:MAG: hypothetical protein FWB99_02785 [Treponema sp.]|nr:hypothetical protein [Treponema sp.]
MDTDENTGVFLTLNDCTALYPRFKGSESFLSEGERTVLLKIEKALYGSLSVREMEELLGKGTAQSAAFGGGYNA